MKDDLISKTAAIKTAERMYKRCDTSSVEDYHDLMVDALTELTPAQPTCTNFVPVADCISRQAAINELKKISFSHWFECGEYLSEDTSEIEIINSNKALEVIEALPSAQPGQRNARVFQGIVVEYPSISAYPEYEGKPYFSIKYTVNGQKFIGYGTYKPEVLSEFLKEYFMPPTQPGWIPCSKEMPPKKGRYLVTEKDAFDNIKVCFRYWNTDCLWSGDQMDKVLAWCEIPEPWEGAQDD